MLSLVRHSPFPSFILHNHKTATIRHDYDEHDYGNNIGMDLIFGNVFDDQTESRRIPSPMIEDENEMDSIYSEYINQRRDDFEKLFNSEAASSSTEDQLDVRLLGGDSSRGSSSSSSSSSDSTCIKRKHSDHAVFTTMNDWISNNQQNKDNKALQFAGTNDNRWVITNTTSEEDLYCEIWNAIYQLYTLVRSLDGNNDDKITNQDHHESNFTGVDNGAGATKQQIVMSTMFITTKYSLFNANQFKQFAITVNGMLRQLNSSAEGEFFLELFHPEYVGKKSSKSNDRRSPFPTLQICHRSQEK